MELTSVPVRTPVADLPAAAASQEAVDTTMVASITQPVTEPFIEPAADPPMHATLGASVDATNADRPNPAITTLSFPSVTAADSSENAKVEAAIDAANGDQTAPAITPPLMPAIQAASPSGANNEASVDTSDSGPAIPPRSGRAAAVNGNASREAIVPFEYQQRPNFRGSFLVHHAGTYRSERNPGIEVTQTTTREERPRVPKDSEPGQMGTSTLCWAGNGPAPEHFAGAQAEKPLSRGQRVVKALKGLICFCSG